MIVVIIAAACALAATTVTLAVHARTGFLRGRPARYAEQLLNATSPEPAPVMGDAELRHLLSNGNHDGQPSAAELRVAAVLSSPAAQQIRTWSTAAAAAIRSRVR